MKHGHHPSMASAAEKRARALLVAKKLEAEGLHTFIWRKKLELQPTCPSLRSEKKRCLQRLEEMERVKRRRARYGEEKARREAERETLLRQTARATDYSDDLQRKEAEFVLNQSKMRSEIRLRRGRPKPIDILRSLVSCLEESEGGLELEDPVEVFEGLSTAELEALKGEITLHLEAEHATPANTQFWEAANVLCEWKINAEGLRAEGAKLLQPDIELDVKTLLQGRSLSQLETMQQEIESKMRCGEAKVVEFWESVIKMVSLQKAKQCLKELCGARPVKPTDSKHRSSEEGEEESAVMTDERNVETEAMAASSPWRKPKYVVKVRLGYQWNKYNRVHYDHDHPPPKMIQGYRFEVYYPDLVGGTPQYSIEKDESSGELCLLRFHAGQPYEDIAFRIVAKEWDYSKKNGFRSTFERGILTLNFSFKRFPYRR